MLGQVLLRRYKVNRLLDEGGMSKIYLARQTDPARDAVVKVLKPELLAQPKTREHFRREIHILSRFQHPHAVAYYDAATREPDGPLLVMEYLRGVDLNTLLLREGRFTPERVGRLLAQLCDVLQAAHDAGIVHRDIKPGNLMILHPGTPHEVVKLMDFGLAKMSSMFYISPEDLVDFNLPAASGTPEYISPEMVRGNDMDQRGDLYSIGVLLFEMLAGRRPFVRDSIEELMVAHRDEPPPRFAEIGLPDLVSPDLEGVVQTCLHKNPDKRPASAWDLALNYERALGRRISSGRAVQRTPTNLAHNNPPGTPRPDMVRPAGAPVQRDVVQESFEANMPEVMALLKVKGFISDLGGEVLESVPGMIRVRLIEPEEARPQGGLLGWMNTRRPPKPSTSPELELHMERKNPAQPGLLTITLVLRPGGPATPEWGKQCGQISRDLRAYLMGR